MDKVQIKPSILPKFKILKVKNTLKTQRSYLNNQKQSGKIGGNKNYVSTLETNEKGKLKYKNLLEDYTNQPFSNSYIKNTSLVKAEQNQNSVSTYLKSRRVKSELIEDVNFSTCLQSISQSNQYKQQINLRSFQTVQRTKLMSTNMHAFRIKKSMDTQYKQRSQSEQINKMLSRIQRINKFNQQRIRNSLQNKRSEVRYKNQKLNILYQQFSRIVKNIPEHMKDEKKFDKDVKILIQYFKSIQADETLLNRYSSQNSKTFIGKLIFFIGYQIYIKYQQQISIKRYNQLVLANYYQIYFAMKFKIPLMILQCYLVLIDIALQKNAYSDAQKYAQKCLLASIYYSQKYYEHRCVQKLSMCEYYKGNIYQATYLHDNNGDITQESRRKVRDGYNQQQQHDLVFHHLYELPIFDIRQLLVDYSSRIDNYKSLIVFKNPRIGPDESMKQKIDQLKIDLIKMERFKQFKHEVGIIKKQIKIHENLFVVKKQDDQNDNQFKLVKRNLVVNNENQSSQILRAHQSNNRITYVNKKPIKKKLTNQFLEYLRKILIRSF